MRFKNFSDTVNNDRTEKTLWRYSVLFLLVVSVEARSQTVIVNRANPIDSYSHSSIRNIFLGNTVTWQSNVKIQIVDYPSELPLRNKFSEMFLSLTPMKVTMIWIKVSLSGKASPPKILRSEDEVKKYVAENEGAIGYVSNENDLPSNVKVIERE